MVQGKKALQRLEFNAQQQCLAPLNEAGGVPGWEAVEGSCPCTLAAIMYSYSLLPQLPVLCTPICAFFFQFFRKALATHLQSTSDRCTHDSFDHEVQFV